MTTPASRAGGESSTTPSSRAGGESSTTPAASAGDSWSAAFAADLHLRAADATGLARAIELLELCASRTPRLYLLGDVFDLWTSGAELTLPEMQPLFAAFRATARRGLSITFLAGNRDFNLTLADGRALGLDVATSEELAVEIDGARLCLLHGDQLLQDDVAYQRMKRVIRSRPARLLARHLPAALTLRLARRLRGYSERAVAAKPPPRMRIVPEAVLARLERGFERVLCGHVHRCERRDFGSGRELVVLPPFLEEGRFLVLADGALRIASLTGAVVELPPALAAAG